MFKIIMKVIKEVIAEVKLQEMLKKDGYEVRQTKVQLNPCSNIEAFYQGKSILKLPFFYMIESFMKDYNYEPELKQDEPLLIRITVSPDIYFDFPLYVKKGIEGKNLFGTPYTTEELIKLGYLIPSKKVLIPNPILLQSNKQDEGGKHDSNKIH